MTTKLRSDESLGEAAQHLVELRRRYPRGQFFFAKSARPREVLAVTRAVMACADAEHRKAKRFRRPAKSQ